MKKLYSLIAFLLIIGAQITMNAQTLGFYGPFHTHLADGPTLAGNSTYLTDPSVVGNSEALVFITANYSVANTFANFHAAVWYTGGEWSIYDEAQADFVEYTAWNVGVLERGGNTFVHTATVENSVENYTVMNLEGVTDDPNALVFITHNWSANEAGVYVNNAAGVWYDGANWAIYNEDLSNIQLDAAYNTFVANTSDHAFQHVATEENTVTDLTYIDHPLLNGNPDARILITHNWGAIGQSMNIYNTSPNAALYDELQEKWVITNEDLLAFEPNTTFNVLILNLLQGETCSIPLPIDCSMGSVSGSTIGVPNDVVASDANECEEVGNGGQIWYEYVATEDALVTLSTCSSDWDTRISVYEGSCGNFICVDSDDDSCNDVQSSLEFQAIAGETYKIYLGGYQNFEGEYVLDISCVPHVGIEDVETASSFLVYPNPAQNNVAIQLPFEGAEPVLIQITDMTGRIVMTETVAGAKPNHSINVSALSNGIYSLNLIQSNQVYSEQLVITH